MDNNFVNMTVFYSTLTGAIFSVMTGEYTLDIYGDNLDMKQNKDYLIIPFNEILLNEIFIYEVDLEEKRIRLKSKYKEFL